MKTLRDVPLRQVPVVEPSTSLEEALLLMREEPLGTIILVGDQQYMGLFNEATMASNLIPPDADLSTLQVGPYVHPSRVIGSPDMPVETALSLMSRKAQDLIPVVAGPIYKGVLTRADLESIEQ